METSWKEAGGGKEERREVRNCTRRSEEKVRRERK